MELGKSLKILKIDIIKGVLELIILIILLAIPISLCFIGYWNPQKKVIRIKDKYIKNYENSSTYLVIDTDNNTYKISDLLFKGKFNSTDIYNSLEIDKTYEIETTGYRIQFFSSYPNINKVELKDE